jgi:CubicO group peptidase (beta-lactamase class C family)
LSGGDEVSLSRRAFLGTLLGAAGTARADDAAQLAPFDELMTSFVREQQVPGAALAVTTDSRLVYARGFGLADRERGEAVQPTALFRIASVSKPITAVAVLQLIERGTLAFDARVCDVLELPPPSDARWKRITILQLLRHTGGWDRNEDGDPMLQSMRIARAEHVPPPAAPPQIIRYMLGQRLDFDPGQGFAYSNFGYCLLGRAIERASGVAYEEYVQREVLAPLGIRRMRLGKTLPAQRAAGEVTYYDDRTGPAVMGTVGARVPLPYGAWSLEAMDSHGGWLASAIDLVRFASAFDVPAGCKILKSQTIATMFARPDDAAGYDAAGKPRVPYYGCGWWVRPLAQRGRVNTWHTGSLPGTSTLLVRRYDGRNWAVLFNMRTARDGHRFSDKIDPLLHAAAGRVRRWPETDRFQGLL